MATTGIVNGHYLRIYVDGTAVAKATECSIEWTAEMKELSTAHKDAVAGGWREITPGQKSGNCSTNGLYSEETNSFASLWEKYNDGTKVAIQFKTGESGDTVWYADGYINSMSLNAPDNENVTYSISIDFTGESVMS